MFKEEEKFTRALKKIIENHINKTQSSYTN